MAREVEFCQQCGSQNWPWSGCECDTPCGCCATDSSLATLPNADVRERLNERINRQ